MPKAMQQGNVKLATAFIDLTIKKSNLRKGIAEAKAEVAGLTGKLQVASAFVTKFTKVGNAIREWAERVNILGTVFAGAFAAGTVGVLGLVKVANPAAFDRFTAAGLSMAAVIGQMFVPYVERATMWVQQFADTIYNLDPATKAWVANLVVTGTALAGLGMGFKVLGKTAHVVGAAMGMLGGAAQFFVAALVKLPAILGVLGNMLGSGLVFLAGVPEVLALVAALGGLYYWLTQTQSGTAVLARIGETLGYVWERTKMVFVAIAEALAPAFEAVGVLFDVVFSALGAAFGAVMQAMQPILDIMGQAAWYGFVAVLKAIEGVAWTVSAAIIKMAEALGWVVQTLADFWTLGLQPSGRAELTDTDFESTGGSFAALPSAKGLGSHEAPKFSQIADIGRQLQLEALKMPGDDKQQQQLDTLIESNSTLGRIEGLMGRLVEKPVGLT